MTQTTIDTLTQTVRDTHGIDALDAARQVVTVHVDQISDDPGLWDANTSTLTDAGVELVTGAIAESYAQGYHATAAQQLLDDIADEAAAIEAATRVVAEATARRDEIIRAALRTELPRAAIARAADLKEARLYQIRDGRR
jgi:hypothetical protein